MPTAFVTGATGFLGLNLVEQLSERGWVVVAYHRRYRTAASDTYHLARALAFFDDAERDDPRLVGLGRDEWAAIKTFFTRESTRLVTRDD